MSHVTAFKPPVPEQIKARYVAMARLGREVDGPEDKLASFPMAVKRETGEKVVASMKSDRAGRRWERRPLAGGRDVGRMPCCCAIAPQGHEPYKHAT